MTKFTKKSCNCSRNYIKLLKRNYYFQFYNVIIHSTRAQSFLNSFLKLINKMIKIDHFPPIIIIIVKHEIVIEIKSITQILRTIPTVTVRVIVRRSWMRNWADNEKRVRVVRRREGIRPRGAISISPTIIRGSAVMLVCVRIKRYLLPGRLLSMLSRVITANRSFLVDQIRRGTSAY